jgi:hypothetical protein
MPLVPAAMIAPSAANAVPPKNLRLLESTPRSAFAAFFSAMTILPFPTFCRFFQPGCHPDRVGVFAVCGHAARRREAALRLPIHSVSIGNAASFGDAEGRSIRQRHSHRTQACIGRIKPRLKFWQQLAH